MSDDPIQDPDPVTGSDAGRDRTASGPEGAAGGDVADVELAIVTMTFDAADATADAALLALLSKYVVLTRMADGCRNVDLCSSVTVSGRHLVVQKWDSVAHQRRHFDSAVMVEMAESCRGKLASAPQIDLWDATSAHDLR